MYLLIDNNNVIVKISDLITEREDGFYIEKEDCIYPPHLKVTLIKIDNLPDGVMAYKYCYINNNFELNSEYTENVNIENKVKNLEIENENLKTQIQTLSQTVVKMSVL